MHIFVVKYYRIYGVAHEIHKSRKIVRNSAQNIRNSNEIRLGRTGDGVIWWRQADSCADDR